MRSVGVFAADYHGRTALGVLVDANEFLVFQKFYHLGRCIPYIAPDHQRNTEHAPEREMHRVFIVGTTAERDVSFIIHSDDEHIYVVIASRGGKPDLVKLAVSDVPDADDIVENVGRRPVKMRARRSDPVMDVGKAVARGVDDVSAARTESQAHTAVKDLIIYRLRLVAIIIFEIIDAPFRKSLCVLELMIETCGIALAGARARARIDAEFQSL